jgi:hypothetical protein
MVDYTEKTGIIKFAKLIENVLVIFSIGWFPLLIYFLTDGAPSLWDYFLYDIGPKFIAITSLVFLLLYLKIKGIHFQSLLSLLRRPIIYLVLLNFLGSYLISRYPDAPLFEIRFRLSQEALENFSQQRLLDNDPSTIRWVGLFLLYDIDVQGSSVRMLTGGCHLFDDCGFVYSPRGEPPIIGEDIYDKMPFAQKWYYWHRSW